MLHEPIPRVGRPWIAQQALRHHQSHPTAWLEPVERLFQKQHFCWHLSLKLIGGHPTRLSPPLPDPRQFVSAQDRRISHREAIGGITNDEIQASLGDLLLDAGLSLLWKSKAIHVIDMFRISIQEREL